MYRKRYSKLNLRKLVLILEKYSNDKIPAGQPTGSAELDKILASMIVVHKSDTQFVAKKLRESLNFK